MPKPANCLLGSLIILVAAMSSFSVLQSAELAQPHKLLTPNQFATSPGDTEPRGVSGMACLGSHGDAERECLVVNDEEPFGQVALLTIDKLTAAPRPQGLVTFIKDHDTGEGILGTEPDVHCPGSPKGFEDLDGEGVAFARDSAGQGYLYVSGSHSCSGKGHFKPSNYILARFKVDGPDSVRGNTEPVIERTWRLSDALRQSMVADDFGKAKAIGTNVEGIAVIGDRLYAGLRTPVRDGHAYIVSARIEDLFAPDHTPLKREKPEERSIPLRLPKDTGIRDLAALKGDGLLILTGPTQDQENVGYCLYRLAKPTADAELQLLGEITTTTKGDDGDRAKAETVSVLDETDDKLTVLIMYDNIHEGEPTRYEIPVRPQLSQKSLCAAA